MTAEATPGREDQRLAFAAALVKARVDAGLSRAALGALTGVGEDKISSWETCLDEPDDHQIVDQLEQLLDLPPGDLTCILWGCRPFDPSDAPGGVVEAIWAADELDGLGKRLVMAVYRSMRRVS